MSKPMRTSTTLTTFPPRLCLLYREWGQDVSIYQTTQHHTPENSESPDLPLWERQVSYRAAWKSFFLSVHWDRAQLKERQTDSERSPSPHERRESRTRGPDCQTDRYILLSWTVAQVTRFTVLSHIFHGTKQLSLRTYSKHSNAILSITHVAVQKYKKFWKQLVAYLTWYDTNRTEDNSSTNSSIVAHVFVAAVTCLPSRCLATVGVNKVKLSLCLTN
jgi:hypothetical protein